MELNQQSIHDAIHPTAAFCNCISEDEISNREVARIDVPWDASSLNPKNRIDSLAELRHPLWRIDGCTAFGTQIYAVPLFAGTIPPFRVDVFIPEPATLPSYVREVLDLEITFYTRDKSRISPLGITRHILRILQHWSSKYDNPAKIYDNLPFGSRIVLHNLPINIAEARISIAPTHYLERQLLSLSTLTEFWCHDVQLPCAVDINDVTYLTQLHDSVCVVEIESSKWIFKALTSYTKYMYHELRQLLTMPPHPNIISRPVHLVTKTCSFGNKTAVVGFTVENHVHGSLRDLIPFLQLHSQVSDAEKTKWSLQLASALLHLRNETRIFYPDLRLDNIVLSQSRDAIMIDFEQRGVWCEFAAPEVNAIEYIRLLAIDDEIDPAIKDKYADILTSMLPQWEDMGQGEDYTWPCQGYNVPWACLTRLEQEACEVYMLGRVLWCIFEATSAPQRAAVWLSYRWEPLVEFPSYTSRTPQPMRDVIDACTRGRKPGLSKYIVRKQDRLVLRELENMNVSTAPQVQQTAKEWWAREIEFSEKWLRERAYGMKQGTWNENYYNRPRLQDVYDALVEFQAKCAYE